MYYHHLRWSGGRQLMVLDLSTCLRARTGHLGDERPASYLFYLSV